MANDYPDYALLYQSLAPRCRANHQSAFPPWLISEPSHFQIRSGRQISPTSHCGRASCTWWWLWICSPGTCSVGSLRTDLTRSSAWRPWRWPWPVTASPRSSIPIRAVNSPHRPSFNDSGQKTSRSAGQAGGGTLTTSWAGGEAVAQSSMRRCICVPTAMAGKRRSVWPASSGGMAM